MFRCQIQDRSTVKCPGLKIECDTKEDYELSYGAKALFFKNNDTLKINEEELRFDGSGDYISATIMIPENTHDTIRFLTGERIPFSIDFIKQNEEGYKVRFTVETIDERKRVSKKTMESKELLTPGRWPMVDILFLDGEFYFVVDGKVWIRRIFEGTYNMSPYGTLCFGGNMDLSIVKNCFGMFAIMLSKDIYSEHDTELETILDKAVDDKLFLFENAYYDAVDNGYDLGPLKNARKRQGLRDGYKEYVFKHGVIWELNKEYAYISEKFYKEIETMLEKWDKYADLYFGLPKAEVILKENEAGYLLFPNWALFYLSKEDRFVLLKGEYLERYVAADSKEFGPWYPVAGEQKRTVNPWANEGEQKSMYYVMFSNGLVMWSISEKDEKTAVLVPGEIFFLMGYDEILPPDEEDGSASVKKPEYKPMFYASADYAEGVPEPVADYQVTYDADGKVFCYCLPCKECWAYYFTGWRDVILTNRNVGSITDIKIREKNRDFENFYAEYINFENGVIVKYKTPTKKYAVHSSLEMRPVSVTTGKINDFPDEDAEVFIKLSVYTDKGIIVENKTLGSKSLSSGKNYTFNTGDGWNSFVLEPLQSGSYIRVIIKVYDYDLLSDEDCLGRFDYQYDIFNGWGVDFHDTGIYTLPMTEKKDDCLNGVWTNQLTLALGEHYSRDELTMHWRKSYGFPFGNFGGGYEFDTNQFARVFDNVKVLSDLKCNFWNVGGLFLETLFFTICNIVRSYGKCGGFSISSAEAYFGQGAFIPPLFNKLKSSIINDKSKGQWKYSDIKPEVANPIVDAYYRQVGWDFLMWVWKKMTSGEFDSLERSIEKIKKRINDEGCCLVLMYPKNRNVKYAHLTLAYKHEGKGLSTKFFVVESNCPYDPSLPDDGCSLTFSDDRVYLNKLMGGKEEQPILEDIKFTHVTEIPFSLVSRRPRVPSVLDFFIGGLENMILGFVEGTVDVFGGDCELDPLITNREWAEDVSHPLESLKVTQEIAQFSISGADEDSTPQGHFFLCPSDNINLTFRKAEQGNVKVTLVSSKTKVELQTYMKEKEKFTITTEHINEIHGARLEVKRTGKESSVTMTLSRSVKPGLISHKYKHVLDVNRNGTYVEGSKFGIRLMAKKMLSDGTVFSETPLKAERNIKVSRNPYFSHAPKNPGATVMNKYFSVKQYANVYKVSEAAVRQACRDSSLAGAYKKNRKWVVPAKSRIVSTK